MLNGLLTVQNDLKRAPPFELSPNHLGKFIAVLCTKSCFIYEVEEGKKIGTIEAFERSLIRWAALQGVDANLLALLDRQNSFTLRWCVDGEFALPEVKLDLAVACGSVESFELDAAGILTMQADGTLNSFAAPFVAGQIGSLAALSRSLQSLTRVFEGVFEGISKLSRFASELRTKIATATNSASLRNLMLFGGEFEASLLLIAEGEFVAFKQRLKKLHAELLVSIGDAQAASRQIKTKFSEFGAQEAAKLADELIPSIEQASRTTQHALAELLLWLEPLLLEEPKKKPAKPFHPQELAIRTIKTILQGGDEVLDSSAFKREFEANKLQLDGKFAAILGSQREAQVCLRTRSTFKQEPGSRVVSADGTLCLPDGCTHVRNGIPAELHKSYETSVQIHEYFLEIK